MRKSEPVAGLFRDRRAARGPAHAAAGRPAPVSALIALIFLIGLSALPAAADTAASSSDSSSDTAASGYVVAFGSIADRGLSASERGFPSAFLLLVSKKLPSDLPPRSEQSEYQAEKAALSSLSGLYSAGAELSSKLDSLALIALKPGLADEKRRQDRDSALSEAEKARRKLDDLQSEKKDVPEAPAADTQNAGSRTSLYADNLSGTFIEVGKAGPGPAVSGKGISLLVYGEAEDSGGFVALSLHGYDSALGRIVFSWRDYADPADPEPLADELAERIAAWVGGQNYARIAIDLSPSRAYLLVDGRVLDQDERILYLPGSGSVLIEAASPGYEARALRLDYAPGDRKHVGLTLASVPTGSAQISTDPAGASLSLNGLPLGASPVLTDLTGERSVLSASAPGYEPATAILPASGKAAMELKLRPDDGIGPEGRLSRARDSFYWSLGFLILSIPIATISYAATYSYSAAGSAAYGTRYYSDIYQKWQTAYYIYGAALALNAGTAINAAVHLVFYIKATQ